MVVDCNGMVIVEGAAARFLRAGYSRPAKVVTVGPGGRKRGFDKGTVPVVIELTDSFLDRRRTLFTRADRLAELELVATQPLPATTQKPQDEGGDAVATSSKRRESTVVDGAGGASRVSGPAQPQDEEER